MSDEYDVRVEVVERSGVFSVWLVESSESTFSAVVMGRSDTLEGAERYRKGLVEHERRTGKRVREVLGVRRVG